MLSESGGKRAYSREPANSLACARAGDGQLEPARDGETRVLPGGSARLHPGSSGAGIDDQRAPAGEPGISDAPLAAGHPHGEAPRMEAIPAWKRGVDLVAAACLLILLLPLGLVVAAWIRATSRGPVFFRQQRAGLRGQPFLIWKFRTMCADADSQLHEQYVKQLARSQSTLRKIDEQYRLIPGGRWMRLLAIDELPQLLNVLAGEMSLVGPRPDVVPFDDYAPWQRARFDVLPGMTGLWQVNGKNSTTFVEMIQLDLAYIRRRSFWFDLRILLVTLPAMMLQCWEGQAEATGRRRDEQPRIDG